MEFKGTKGKWNYTGKEIIYDSEGYAIIPSGNINIEEKEYNFKLASKAPEMLEMLKTIYNIENSEFTKETFNIDDLKRKLGRLIKEATELS